MSTTSTAPSQIDPSTALHRAVAVPFRVQTYRNLLYLLLALPLGIVSVTWLVTGGVLGASLVITWVGLPILVLTLSGATVAAGIEARLAESLVGVDASVPAFLSEFRVEDELALPGDGFVEAIRQLVTAPSTWTSVVLLVTKFVAGIVSFVAVVTTTAIAGALLAAPFVYDDAGVSLGAASPAAAGNYTIGSWTVSTLPEALVVAAAGVVFVLVALNLLNGLARIHALCTTSLLGANDGA